MLVTDIIRQDKRKSLVYIDYEKAFSLYNTEISKYNICIDEEMPEEAYRTIMQEVLPVRCRERAFYILKDSDKSENDIRVKLTQGGYPEVIIDRVIEKLREYRYVDDKRYAYNYAKYNIASKSKNRIKNELRAKGISKDIIENAFEDNEFDEEELKNKQYEIIKKEFIKKKYDFESDDKLARSKIIASLMRKGFNYDEINHVYVYMKNLI